MTPFEKARQAFDNYAHLNVPHLPQGTFPAAQVALFRWVQTKVAKHTLPASVENTLGAAEEVGELHEVTAAIGKLCHYELNISQGRRYEGKTVEELRALKADAVADICIFLMNLCTAERIDFSTLVLATLDEVIQRDWKANPNGAHLTITYCEDCGEVLEKDATMCMQCGDIRRPPPTPMPSDGVFKP